MSLDFLLTWVFFSHISGSLGSVKSTLHNVYRHLMIGVKLEILYHVYGLLIDIGCDFNIIAFFAFASMDIQFLSFNTFDLLVISISTYQFFYRSRSLSFSVVGLLVFVVNTCPPSWHFFFFIIVFGEEALKWWFVFIIIWKLVRGLFLIIFGDPKVFHPNYFILIYDVNLVDYVAIVMN